MLTPARVARRIHYLFHRRALERELDEEMRFHLEMDAASHGSSLPASDARAAARRRFGNVERYKDECREARGLSLLDDLQRDIRFAARTLTRRPVTTAVCVLTLALGIGGTTAIFGAVYGILLAPLPYRQSERMLFAWEHNHKSNDPRDGVAPANFLDWRERSHAVQLAAAEPFSLDYEGPDGPMRFRNARVTEDFFDVAGTAPMLGRTFLREEFTSGRDRVVVLSYDLWRAHFHGDSALVDRTLVLDSVPRTVIGVMPRGFRLPDGEDVWSPKVFEQEERQDRTASYYTVVGRLRPDYSMDAARRELTGITEALAREHPRTNGHIGVTPVPLPEQLLGRARNALWMLLGAVVCVLLIACANVANLQLAAAARRRREFSIRIALGVRPLRLVRQLLTEHLLLACIGGAAGLLLAHLGLASIRALAPRDLPRVDSLTLSMPVIAFALALTMMTALLFGLAPVLRAAWVDVQQGLAADARAASIGRSRRRIGAALVMLEMALALVLLVGAALLAKSFASLLDVDRGFDTRGVTVVTLQAWGYYPTAEKRVAFVRQATERLAALPGVESAGMTSSLPLSEPIGAERTGLTIDGDARPATEESSARVQAVTPGYFASLRIPLRRGRMLGTQDDTRGAPVVLVNETLARRYWPGENPVGRRLTFAFMGAPRSREIIGVVGDVRHDGLNEEPRPSVFVPHAQAGTGAVHLVIRSRNADVSTAMIRRELYATNRAMPLTDVRTLEGLLDRSLRERRFHLALLGSFALLALVLAAVGIYGVMSSVTAERTHEIGIRMALGAEARHVLRMVMRQGMTVALAGVMLGLLGAAIVTRLLREMLFHVGPFDLTAFISGVAALLAVASLACWLPALRAARLDPVRAIRVE